MFYSEFMTDFVAALKTEIAELEAELQADPRRRKLERLRDTLAEYEPLNRNATPALTQTDANSSGPTPAAPGLAAMSKSARMKSEVTAILSRRGAVHRKELLRHLVNRGIMGNEKDPMQALAIFLSSHKEVFEFDGGGNWSLRKTSS
jgi:hypothetical protein